MDFKGVGNKKAMHDGIFKEKIEWNKCKKVDFLKIRHFLIAGMGKASSEKCTKQGTHCTSKTLSCNKWIALWLHQQQKWPVKQKKLISTPDSSVITTLLTTKLYQGLIFDGTWHTKLKFIFNKLATQHPIKGTAAKMVQYYQQNDSINYIPCTNSSKMIFGSNDT